MHPTTIERLRGHLAERGQSQLDLARATGVRATTVSKILHGHRLPTLAQAVAIERETGIPVAAWAEALDADEPAETASPPSDPKAAE